jgi:type II secretory pathway pseudopilin PulG
MFSHYFHHYNKFLRKTNGFGLIELLVSISIMMLVITIIFVRQNSFNGSVLLESQAYEMALSAREVQQNAVSASSIRGDTREFLGLYVSKNRDNTYRIFRDADGDIYYDPTEEYGQQGGISERFQIKDIKVGGSSVDEISIVFARPDFDARFILPGTGEVSASQVEVDIGLRDNSTTDIHTVVVTSTGQVAVE